MLQGSTIFQDRQEGEISDIQQAQKQSSIPGKEDPLASIQAGERLVTSLVEKAFGNPWWTVTESQPAMLPGCRDSPQSPGLYQQKSWQQIAGGAYFLCSVLRPYLENYNQFQIPTLQERY